MKGSTIKSNKWGRGIHSPFVYRLVTEIIFSKYPFYSFEEIKKISGFAEENKELEIIFRLLNFFQPEFIQTIGENDEKMVKVCKWVLPTIDVKNFTCAGKTPESEVLNLESNTFILWNTYCDETSFDLTNKQEITIVFRNLKELQMKQLFAKFKEKEEVSVTIEFRRFGIVIINGKFQKQNYVINR